MAKPGPARRPTLAVVREGNPGKRPAEDLEGGVKLKPKAPDEPSWIEWFPAVRIPTETQLEGRVSRLEFEGQLAHIEDDSKREYLAEARRAWTIRNEIVTAERARKVNQRCRDVCRDTWRRVVPVMDSQGLLSVVDLDVLRDYCIGVARLDQCERDISDRGMWVQGERGAQKNPSTTVANQYRTRLKYLEGELGMTPVARDSLTPGGSDGEGSPFDV